MVARICTNLQTKYLWCVVQHTESACTNTPAVVCDFAPLAMLQIFVWTLTGRTVTMNVNPSDTVADVLLLVSEVEQRRSWEKKAISALENGIIAGERLAVVRTGQEFELSELVSSMGIEGSDTRLLKVILRKTLHDNLLEEDWHILKILEEHYYKLLEEKYFNSQCYPTADPRMVFVAEPTPMVLFDVHCLTMQAALVLADPPLDETSLVTIGLVFEHQGLLYDGRSFIPMDEA